MIDFNKMVDDHLHREHIPKKIGRYYPSEIGTCLRKVWFSYKFPQEVDADKLKIFELGNILHSFVVDVLKSDKNKQAELLKAEMPLKVECDDFLVSGRVDDLILLKANGQTALLEVKSCKSLAYQSKISQAHEAQLQFYMHATSVHNGAVLYVDKTNLQSKTFPVEYSPHKAGGVLERFKTLHACLTQEKIPVPEAKLDPEQRWMCGYCEYRERCDQAP